MEQNARSTDNLVFSQSLSHDQLQNNREVLARRLQLRRPREELVNQGIMPAVSAAPIILQQKSKLERARKSDILQRKIRVRPDRSQLIRMHILEDSNADPSIQAAQINLKRKKLQDDLNERLLMRPGPLELVTKNILDPNSFVGHAVKEGNLEYTDTKNSTLIVNALSPPESFNDDSPQPSPDSASIGSPSEPSPSPVFVSPTKMMFQGSQPSFPVTGHMKLKHDTKSRKKSSKAKFKKYKYHEYRPPNTETSSSKSDTTLPADSPYALLLQQQQLYLQLQVLCQNYPQTFLPLLPAVQKNSQSESQPAEKPMKLEEMRVIDLRNELKSRGLPVSGSKNNLMERLKLANAAQQESGNLATVTSAVSMVTQTTPVAVAPRTTLTRSTSAPGGVAMVKSIKPAKIINDAEKILQMEQNISVEEIQKKIQQLQYLNVQLQLQQLDLKKSQQGKALQPKPVSADTASQIPVLPNQQPLHHPSISLASPLPQQLQPQQNQQAQLGAQNQPQQQTIQVQQQKLEQHLQQLKQLQKQQQAEQQKEQKQLHQQQLKHQQFQQQQKLLQQQQQQQANQQLNQQLLYNQLPTSQTPSISLQTKSEPSDVTISSAVTSLPPPQQCQVSISATPLLHCSTLTCNKNCSHVQEASADTTATPNVNSVQQHNVIHFKQPVKPVIILQPAKPQQRAELLFSPPGQQLAGDMTGETFFQHLNKKDGVSSLHGDMSMEHDTNWQAMIENDVHSPSSSPTAVERSPPPYFEAVAGKLSPRSSSFSANNTAGIPKTPQRTNSVGSTSPLANRRSLSVPSVSHSSVQQQDLQKGHKSVSTMCLDFPEADEMSDMADNYHGITQELQKAMLIESQNNVENRNAELLEILGDTLFPANTAAGSALASSTPNLNSYSFPAGGRHYSSSSPKAPRSPTNSLPSYREAIQNSHCVQSTNTGNFNSNEVLNGYHEHSSPVNFNQPQRKISSPNLDENLLASPGSPMRVDTDDIDMLQRSVVLEANGYRRDSFENFRSPNVQNNSLYHVDPSDIFGNPSEARFIKQEDAGLAFLDMETAAAEFAESMDFGMVGESNIPMSGIPFSH